MGDAGGDEQPQSLAQRGKDKVVGKATERLEGMEGGGQISEALSSSSTIHLIMLLQLIPSVYLSWYIVAFVLCLVFGLRGDFFILTFFEPFDYENFSPAVEAGDWRPLVHWLSLVITQTLIAPLLIIIVCYGFCSARPIQRDATTLSTTLGMLHFFLSTTAMQQTPENWVWFATTFPCGYIMGKSAEFVLGRMQNKRKPKRRRITRNFNKTTPYADWKS